MTNKLTHRQWMCSGEGKILHFRMDPDDNRTEVEVTLTPKQMHALRSVVAAHEAGEVNPNHWPSDRRKALRQAVEAMNEAEDSYGQ